MTEDSAHPLDGLSFRILLFVMKLFDLEATDVCLDQCCGYGPYNSILHFNSGPTQHHFAT